LFWKWRIWPRNPVRINSETYWRCHSTHRPRGCHFYFKLVEKIRKKLQNSQKFQVNTKSTILVMTTLPWQRAPARYVRQRCCCPRDALGSWWTST
jgi:hypothetical protein